MTTGNRRWIITGANGYLGGELCQGLQRLGESVLGVVRQGRTPVKLVEGKIAFQTYEAYPACLQAGDIVVHCAGPTEKITGWDQIAETNGKWPAELYEQAARQGAECFIQISSVAALGYQKRPGDSPLEETSEPKHDQGDYYGRSKLLGERELTERAKQHNLRLIILRPGLIYGHKDFPSSQSRMILDRQQRLPLVHIENFLDAVLKIGKSSTAQGIYMVVDQEQPRLYEVNALLIEHGLRKSHPRYGGKVRIRLLLLLKAIWRLLLRRTAKIPQGYTSAQYHLLTRRLRYRTDRLQHDVGWTQRVALPEGLKDCREAERQEKGRD